MKMLKDGAIYVEIEDILHIGFVPLYVADEMNIEEPDDGSLKKFTRKDSIAYFRGRKDILDYESLKKLSDEELKKKIAELSKPVSSLASRLLDFSSELRKYYEKETKYSEKKRNFDFMKSTIERYMNDRAKYDKIFKEAN